MSANPFLEASRQGGFGTPDEAMPFDRLRTEHFLPALDVAIEEARANIKKMREDTSPVTFDNVLLALETSTELFEQVTGIYFNLFSAEAPPELQALAKDISPKATALQSEISLDDKIFARVKELFEKAPTLNLNAEQKQLLDKTYKSFVRNGAQLPPEQKEKLKALDQEMAVISPQYSENLLNATNAFQLFLTDKAELDGLPEGAIEAAAAEAAAKGKPGQWLVTLQVPSFLPFMQYSTRRELREKLWRAYNSRSFGDAFDNQELVLKTARLRFERAKLLGFASHADFVLQERMAQTPSQVFQFLDQLMTPSRKAAQRDLQELRDFARTQGFTGEMKPWDFAFYSEKLKEQKYEFNEEELRPYFKLENVVAGVFEHARRLYGLTFTKRTDVPAYHPEVEVFQVKDEQTGQDVGLFYTDFFPRETKRGGAWMTVFREQGYFRGRVRRPHVSIVCNFTKPTPTKPSLLTYDEVKTLFHEFGHALHGLLSNCHYRSLAGTNVYWDFVELPSQLMENWVGEKEGLDLFARHYQTNAPIPDDLVAKIKRANQFQSGYASLRQLNFALLDMSWHSADPSAVKDVAAFEAKATELTRLFPLEPGTNSSVSFAHIFAGGYSAGYYSYKWAEVLDADAFEFFLEKGLFDAEVALRFKQNVLSRGGTEHPMELYKRFRGREPDPKALLRREGLLEEVP